MRSISSIAENAKRHWVEAQMLVTRQAAGAVAAASPWKCNAPIADLDASYLWTNVYHSPNRFMTRHHWKFYTSIREQQPLTFTKVVKPILEIQIRMANPAVRNLEQHLPTLRLRYWLANKLKRLTRSNEGPVHGFGRFGSHMSFVYG